MIKITTLFFLILSMSASAWSKPNVIGNGGHGILVSNQIFLLDLVECNCHLKPYFGDTSISDSRLINTLSGIFTPEVITLLQRKIYDISKFDKILAESVIVSLQKLRWSISDTHLLLIDVDTVVAGKLVQAAVRTNDLVTISSKVWNQLDSENKAALIIHEVIYTTAKIIDGKKPSFKIRLLTGLLFSHDFPKLSKKEFYENFSSYFTTEQELKIDYAVFENIDRANSFNQFAFNPFLRINNDLQWPLSGRTQFELEEIVCNEFQKTKFVDIRLHFLNQRLVTSANNTEQSQFVDHGSSRNISTLFITNFDTCFDLSNEVFSQINHNYPFLLKH